MSRHIRAGLSDYPAAAPAPVDTDVTSGELPRLFKSICARHAMALTEHHGVHGALPPPSAHRRQRAIIELVEQAGLRGRGGAAFPTAQKMRAVAASRRHPIVVVNATEGEPASFKDRMLLTRLPHLVLDGAVLTARALGADEVVVAVCESARAGADGVALACAERAGIERRPVNVRIRHVRPGYVVGQETALVNALNNGPGVPTAVPPASFERGVRGLPTMVSNAETYAHIALICRHGPSWFRELGPREQPGSALVTLSGAVANPGVYEIELGVALGALVSAAGGVSRRPQAALVGGYGGAWIGVEHLEDLELSDAGLAAHGASLGAGVVLLLEADACPVAETLRIVNWLAVHSSGQCGPCVHGLRAIADELARVARGSCSRGPAEELERLIAMVRGRGACALPDGTCALVISAIDTFAREFGEHASGGPCEGCSVSSRLAFPGPQR